VESACLWVVDVWRCSGGRKAKISELLQVETNHIILHELPKILTSPEIFLPIII
jgi:hypothetical protein